MDATVTRTESRVLTGDAAIFAVAAEIAVMFMGSTLLTPLYVLYKREFGFSEITLTLIYAVYVVGNLAALLFLGRLSDEVGRRPVSMAAFAVAGLSTLVFLAAGSTAPLYVGRALSGLAVGLASGTGTAWVADLHRGSNKARATVIAATANMLGISLGPLVAGVLAEYAPAPLQLSFVVYLAVLAVVLWRVWQAPETATALGARCRRCGRVSACRAAFASPSPRRPSLYSPSLPSSVSMPP